MNHYLSVKNMLMIHSRFQYLLICPFLLLLLTITSISVCLAQTDTPPINQNFMTTYYGQKTTLHALLPQDESDIIFLGNSITDIGEWAEIWQNNKVKNRGISGDITAGVLARLGQITKGKPAQLFIMIGINDIARNIPADTILANYEKIIHRIQAESPNTRLFVQSILPTNNTYMDFANHQNKTAIILEVNNGLKRLSENLNITYINMYDDFLDKEGRLDSRYTNDGLHLKGEGYMLWKSILAEAGYCCD